jgi:hypothetical protein
MRSRLRLLLLPLLFAGCRFFITRSPAEQARDIAPRCRGFTEEAAAQILSPSLIDSVEPAYTQSGPGDRAERLHGSRIHLRPIATLSRESIARSLECHESRVVLGSTPALADDPYALAGKWLDIDVDSDRDGFVVQMASDDLSTAREALSRAKRFSAQREP